MRVTQQRASSFDTSVFWLMNDAAAAKWARQLHAAPVQLVRAFSLATGVRAATGAKRSRAPGTGAASGDGAAAGQGGGKGAAAAPRRGSATPSLGSNWARMKQLMRAAPKPAPSGRGRFRHKQARGARHTGADASSGAGTQAQATVGSGTTRATGGDMFASQRSSRGRGGGHNKRRRKR